MFNKSNLFFLKARKKIASLALIVFLSFGALQCFAQSSSKSAVDSNVTSKQYRDLVNSVFEFVESNYVDSVDPKVLYEGALKGIMESLNDPYSLYMDSSMMSSLNDTTQGNFGGVGLTITKAAESTPDKPSYVEVVSPIEDTPGAKAGIITGDYIEKINDEDTSLLTMDQVLSKLRGPVGSDVSLLIKRGTNMEFTVSLKRALIEVPSVKYGMIGSVGYVRIIQFSPQAVDHVQEALDSFSKSNYTSLIIDLRNNPGGLIDSAVSIADKFIDNGPIVSTKSRIKYENEVYTASPKNTKIKKGLPIIVLINKGSASASEILSGALKDNHLAYLVGEKSYGKGSVQIPVPLPYDDGVKLTVARYYTPSDVNIDKIGITPDRIILNPDVSTAQESIYQKLSDSKAIENYVMAHPSMTEDQIAAYADFLSHDYPLDTRLLRRLIRVELESKLPARLYDLDYDIQLKTAIDILQKENFQSMMKTTKTLKEMQNEADISAGKDVKVR